MNLSVYLSNLLLFLLFEKDHIILFGHWTVDGKDETSCQTDFLD